MTKYTAEQAKQIRSGIDIQGTITKLGEIRTVNKKDGGTVDVRDCWLKDESGEIKLTLWGTECQSVLENDKVEIVNGYTNSFKGETSLSKGKFGTMTKMV